MSLTLIATTVIVSGLFNISGMFGFIIIFGFLLKKSDLLDGNVL